MGMVMLSEWPNGAGIDPLVATTVLVGILTAVLMVTTI
jgi:hypothetical protein